jgi:beta-glucosidase
MTINKFLTFTLLLAGAALLYSCGPKDWKDPGLGVDERVEALLKQMTLEEKCAQLQNRFVGEDDDVAAALAGKSWGALYSLYADTARYRKIVTDAHRYLKDSTRLDIPVIACAEGIQGLEIDGCTIFPHALAQGSTFNPALINRMADACAEEAGSLGVNQVLSPVLDIARDPRWGRVEETFGEDPYLIAEMALAFVRGYQDKGVACTPKHFVAHGSPTGGLNCASVSGGERELRSLYLYPFERVIREADPCSIMSCYSTYDGVAVSGSRWYLTDLLRGELGFDGYVYSDWGAVERLRNFHFMASDDDEAARIALDAGVDLNVLTAHYSLQKQVEAGLVDESLIDRAVRRLLKVKFRLGLFDSQDAPAPAVIRSDAHRALSKEIADESAILLENDGILPLDLSRIRRIALLGPNSAQTVFGDYCWTLANAPEGINLYQGLRQRLPAGVTLTQMDGCDWWSQDGSRIAEAARIAARSDVAIVAVGSRSSSLARTSDHNTSGEGNDLSSLDLPGRQMDLLRAVKATGTPLVVVLISGKPFAMTWVKDNANAFLVQWYGGEQQGLALADILTGAVNPSGRLNVSFPRSTGNIPCFYNYLPTDREYYGGHGGTYEEPRERYVFEKPYAVWNFGAGLSYTTFEYTGHSLERRTLAQEGDVIREVITVKNTGGRDGHEVIQLYVRDLVSSVVTPVQQLKAFKKVFIPAGCEAKVKLEVPVEELSLVNARMQRVVEPGAFEIQIGGASDRIYFRDTLNVL